MFFKTNTQEGKQLCQKTVFTYYLPYYLLFKNCKYFFRVVTFLGSEKLPGVRLWLRSIELDRIE